MTFIFGSSRLTYDHFGAYPLTQAAATEQVPAGINGDPVHPGELVPGTAMPGEEPETIDITVEVF